MTRRADGMKFRVILADPPWIVVSPGRRPDSGEHCNDDTWFGHKKTLTIDRISSVHLPHMDDSYCFLWSPVGMLTQTMKVLSDWGFRYVTHFVWVKMCKDGVTPWMGMGEFLRNSHELLLVGRSGKTIRNDKGVRSAVLTRPIAGTASKPDEFHGLIERLVPGPYLELFATKRRDGWFAYGDQVPGGSDISIPEWDRLRIE